MQSQVIVKISGDTYYLDEEDLEPLGDVVYFGGTKMHRLEDISFEMLEEGYDV